MFSKIFNFIDSILNRVTMYRLVLYYLAIIWIVALGFSVLHILPYDPFAMFISLAVLLVLSWAANNVFSKVFEAQTNMESVYITALILTLIITPMKSPADFPTLIFLGWAAIWAMASKYIFAFRKKHIFNPAALAVALTALTIGKSASWWVGTPPLLPLVILGGLLVARKLVRFDLVLSFLAAACASVFYFGIARGTDLLTIASQSLITSGLFFFAFVMITEPLTTPPDRRRRILYGLLTGFLFAPAIHIGSIYSTPELALLIGNLFSYLISPKKKLMLKLEEKVLVANDTYDFVFLPDEQMYFRPGQYLEWTLGHEKPDSRGNRRYFTIASSPTEKEIRLGVKFYPEASSFKKTLSDMNPGDKIIASQLAGDFVLPKNNKKLVWIAGGIGITPFRSMAKYLLDKNEKRNIVLFYSNKIKEDIAYRNIFDEAEERAGLRAVYTLTDQEKVPADWAGERGYVDEVMLKKYIPDYMERTFYLSGPRSMVLVFRTTLEKMGVKDRKIVSDYFPGFA
jgi:ferredoxin-NADP reductase